MVAHGSVGIRPMLEATGKAIYLYLSARPLAHEGGANKQKASHFKNPMYNNMHIVTKAHPFQLHSQFQLYLQSCFFTFYLKIYIIFYFRADAHFSLHQHLTAAITESIAFNFKTARSFFQYTRLRGPMVCVKN